MHDHGITSASLARVAAKAFRNGERNPAAWRRKPLTDEEILASPMVADPLTQYMFCSPSAGAVALVVCRPELAARFPAPPVYVRAVSMRSRRFGSFEVFSPSMPVTRGPSPSQEAAQAAYAEAGIGPGEFDVVQVQDTEAGAELMHLAECGLCEDGAQEELMRTGATEIGGAMPVNTDGGCIASGEPIGASGLRQVHETVLQLRGQAGDRQVEGARTGFTHVYGAPPRDSADVTGLGSVAVFDNLTFEQEREQLAAAAAWQRAKLAAGYGAITWPPEFGGAGLTPAYEEA